MSKPSSWSSTKVDPPWGYATQSGVSLVEVLIALVVLSVGLLGVAGLQSSGLQGNHVSYQYSLATALAQGMADRMRANRAAVVSGNYAITGGTAPSNPGVNCMSDSCTSGDLAAWDRAMFYYSVVGQPATAYTTLPAGPNALLPSGRVAISCADATCTAASPWLITVWWDSSRSGATGLNCSPTTLSDLRCYRLSFVP